MVNFCVNKGISSLESLSSTCSSSHSQTFSILLKWPQDQVMSVSHANLLLKEEIIKICLALFVTK
jgi:hypothetical protein